MNNMNNTPEETKQNTYTQESEQTVTQSNPEELLAEITQILNRLFDPKNLINNAYLVKYSKGTNFEIPIEVLYQEYSIREKTTNKEIIDQALLNAENVSVVIRGEKIDAVKPKVEQTKSKVTVIGVEDAHKDEFQQFVNGFLSNPDDILSWSYNNQMNLTILNCKDEDVASNLYEKLTTNSFKGSSLQCSLEFLNLYISALENIKKRKKNKTYQQPRPNPNYYVNPYQMQQAYYQMQMGYMNMYGNQNYYRGQNMNMGGSMNMQGGNGMGPSDGKYYNNGYQKRTFNNYKRGGFNKYRNRNYGNRSNDPNVNVPINDNDFPPLNNEEGNDQE